MKSLKTIEKLYPECLQKNSNYNSSKPIFNWNAQSIKWYFASENTSTFYQKSMEILQPYIKGASTILDIGCGIGSFSIEFAQKEFHVTAIDKSDIVIKSLVERIKLMKLENLEALNVSFEDFKFNKKYDIIFASYMMGLINDNNIDKILEYSNKHLVIILPVSKIKNDFSISDLYREIGIDINSLEQSNHLDIVNALDRKNIKCDTKTFKSDFGQPFETVDEAMLFIYHYFNIPNRNWTRVRDWLNRKLIIKNSMYYLPNIKESAMIII